MKCLCASFRNSARLLTRYYESELRKSGVTAAQFELLGTVLERPGIPQSELAETLGVDQTTLSRNLKILIERKWIGRFCVSGDQRRAAYSLTHAGQEVWRGALPHWKRAQDRIQQRLGADWQNAWSILQRIGDFVPRSSQPPSE